MKQGTMNILFFILKTKLLKNGEAPILMRITIDGHYEEARIQRSVLPKQWDSAKGCSKGKDRTAKELNAYIAELSALALQKHKELMLELALITPKLLLKRVFGKETEMRTLLGTMNEEIEKMKKAVNIDYAPVTINRYINVMKKLQKAIPDFYGKEDITFHELNSDFIATFDLFLKTYNPQIQISAESGTKRSIFRQKNKTKRSKKRLHTTLIKPEQKVNEDLCSGFIVS